MNTLAIRKAIDGLIFFGFFLLSEAALAQQDFTLVQIQNSPLVVHEKLDPDLKLFDALLVTNNSDGTVTFKAMWHTAPDEVSYRFLGYRQKYAPQDLQDLRAIYQSTVAQIFGGVFTGGLAATALGVSVCSYMGRFCVMAALGPLVAPSFTGYRSGGLTTRLRYLAFGATSWVIIGVAVVGSGIAMSGNIGQDSRVNLDLLNNSPMNTDRNWLRRYMDSLFRGIPINATPAEILTVHVLEIESTLNRLDRPSLLRPDPPEEQKIPNSVHPNVNRHRGS